MLALTLVLNYLTTGLADDQGLLLFWTFADLDRLNRWDALPLVMIQHHGVTGMAAVSLPFGFQLLRLLVESSRVEMLLPLALGGAIFSIAAFARLPKLRAPAIPFSILAASILVFVGLALTAGRMQPISFYRYASFQVAVSISAGILLWAIAGAGGDGLLSRFARNAWVSFICLVVCLLSAVDLTLARTHLGRAVNFAIGKYSIDRAYETQFGPPPRQLWTAIYPGSRAAYDIVGPNTPIWSMHIHLYCMLPNCRVESYPSFIMTPRWDRVMFGTPAEGREALKSANVNYFLFTREDQIADPLPLSPLFRPDDIGKYLGIRWTDGTTTLLTWLGPDTRPIDAAWLDSYRKSVADSGTVNSFPYDAMKAIFLRLDATPHPWHSFPLPWERK